MDPQSQSFTPHTHGSDNWRLQNDVTRIQQVQTEHADRIIRLERRQEDDARMKSVWGNQSPFPSVLSGTPQQAPLQQPNGDHFRNFDDEATNLMSSLHLDAEEEPRRGLGTTSRANSVRFDESANQNHFSHSSRPSVDFLSRTSSGLGGLQMTERTSSHKSEGRASSAHSFRSLASGRASSLNLDSVACGLSDSNNSPSEVPGIAPGLMLLGPAPAIIRCWMNTNFKHDALLYAAVCTGSYKSYLDLRLITKLGFDAVIRTDDDGLRTVKLPMFFPEAVPHPPSSRSSSPAPTLPSLLIEFRVIERQDEDDNGKAIQIFLGADVLRAHCADILFSMNSMTMFDNERNKLSIPLTRPEDEGAFNGLLVSNGSLQSTQRRVENESVGNEPPYVNRVAQGSSATSLSSTIASPSLGKYRPPGVVAPETGAADHARPAGHASDQESRPLSRRSSASRRSLSLRHTKPEREEVQNEASQTTPLQPDSSPAVWSNWRRDGASSTAPQANGMDWASASTNRETSYQRKEAGIKVLKPKTTSRTSSTTAAVPTNSTTTSNSTDGKSRFFDDGRRRSVSEHSSKSTLHSKESSPASGGLNMTGRTKANPVGGAFAFPWLNSGGAK